MFCELRSGVAGAGSALLLRCRAGPVARRRPPPSVALSLSGEALPEEVVAESSLLLVGRCGSLGKGLRRCPSIEFVSSLPLERNGGLA